MIARRLSIPDGLLSIAKEETEHTEGGGIEFTEVIRRNIKKGSKQHHYSSRYKFLVSVFSVSSVPLSFGVFRCSQKLGRTEARPRRKLEVSVALFDGD
jgi:hypothetical protein